MKERQRSVPKTEKLDDKKLSAFQIGHAAVVLSSVSLMIAGVGYAGYAVAGAIKKEQYPAFDPSKPARITGKHIDAPSGGGVGILPTPLKGVPVILYPEARHDGGYTIEVGQTVHNRDGDTKVLERGLDASKQEYQEHEQGQIVIPDDIDPDYPDSRR